MAGRTIHWEILGTGLAFLYSFYSTEQAVRQAPVDNTLGKVVIGVFEYNFIL